MCGIIGYLGLEPAAPILLEGLRRLEYRGYDSAGIAVWDGTQFGVNKVKGRVAELARVVAEHPLAGSVGIAHTRWATHGEPSLVNAHPHTDCHGDVYVVHNGIIENHQLLRRELEQEGHRFVSGTDTEVLPHLIEKFLHSGSDLAQATRRALALVQGTYALLVIAKSDPGKIVAARLASPLRIGVGKEQLIVASDPSAMVSYTEQAVSLADRELAILTPQGYTISSLSSGETIDRELEKLEWNLEAMQKGGYPHFMLKEIMEQPEVVTNSLRGRLVTDEGRAMLGGLRSVDEQLRQMKRLTIVACGSAYHAGLVGEYMLEEYAGIPTEVCIASEWRYRKAILTPGEDVVLAVSQSGETADTLAAVHEAKQKGVLVLGLVNVVGSSIARETKAGVYNHAGPEIGVASTKVFISQLSVLALFTLLLGRQRLMSLVMGTRIAEELKQLPNHLAATLELGDRVKALAQQYLGYKNFYFLGRKYNYPVALEGALKLKEISYLHAEGGAAGELKHGPLAMIDKNFPTIFLCPRDSVYEKNISNMEEVKARGGRVLAIGTAGDEELARVADDVLYIPKTLEMLTPILMAVPLQLFAYHVANALGLDVDKPRNLAKSVTVE